jgi:ABC-type uncharacterized transport system ATPase subunit
MNRDAEVIALLVDEPVDGAEDSAIENTGAHRLIRESDGRVSLEPIESQAEFDRMAKDTGCFRRGRAIRDPKTFEVIGYEMVEITPSPLAVAG